MPTYYDHRAERTVAEAEADTRRAQAEALRAETALRLERERRQLQREDLQEQRRDKAAKKEARSLTWKNRRTGTRKGARTLAAAAKAHSHSFVAAAAMGSPMFIAWGGQYAFAEDVMHMGAAAVTLPIAMEGSVLYTAYLTHRAIDKGLPAGRYRLMTWVQACNAAGMNLWHQVDKLATPADAWAGLQIGAIYAASSLLGIVLWEMNAALKRQTASRRSGTDIRRAMWRRLRYPRLSWSAASIRAAQGCAVEEAWTVAWNDRYGVGPDASRRDRRLARKIVRYRGKADREAAKSGRLAIRDGVIVGRPPADIEPRNPEGEKALETLRSFDSNAATRRALRRTSMALSAGCADTSTTVSLAVSAPVSPQVSLVPRLPFLQRLARVAAAPTTDTPTDTETATASATDAMRHYWDQEIDKGRVPSGPELADAGHCGESYGRRMRRLWLDAMDGRTRRRLLSTKKVTA